MLQGKIVEQLLEDGQLGFDGGVLGAAERCAMGGVGGREG